MGLCENVAPVELVTGKGKSTPCSTLCNLTYDYGNSDCVLSNKGDHLDIQCYDGTNQVDFTGYKNLSVVSVRLYNGSLNKYDGKHFPGELIIQHSSGRSNVFVCIPVESTRVTTESTKWFKNFMSQIPINKKAGQIVSNVAGFTLNKVIPKGPYYYVEDAPFDAGLKYGCNEKDKLIIFDGSNPTRMHYKDLVYLKNRIQALGGLLKTQKLTKEKLQYNKTGTTNGPGKGDDNEGPGTGMTCVPITDLHGKSVASKTAGKVLSWVQDIGPSGLEEFSFEKHVLPYLIPIICVVFVLILLALWRWMHSSSTGFKIPKVSLFKKKGSSGGTAGAGE